MSQLRKDPIPNQDNKSLGIKKYQCLTSDVPEIFPVNKALRNQVNDDNPETTDTSHTEKDDTSHTNRDNYIANETA